MTAVATWACASAGVITLWILLSRPYDRGFADGVRAERLRRRCQDLAERSGYEIAPRHETKKGTHA